MNTSADLSRDAAQLGTPADYTHDMYRVYFEVCDVDGMVRKIIAGFVGDERAASIVTVAHGYQVELPIQCVPEIVRLLAAENIAVYQVVRLAKTNGVWA